MVSHNSSVASFRVLWKNKIKNEINMLVLGVLFLKPPQQIQPKSCWFQGF
jgi:hypothetical protein